MAVTREERMWEAMLNDAPEKIPTAVTRKERMLKKLAKQACDNDTFSGSEPLAYEDVIIEQLYSDVLESTTTFDDSEVYFTSMFPNGYNSADISAKKGIWGVKAGEEVVVLFNGTEYICTVGGIDFYSEYYIGNGNLYKTEYDEADYPFCISVRPNATMSQLYTNKGGTYVIEIIRRNTEIKTIDRKYMPDGAVIANNNAVAFQQLVTDAEGNKLWADRLAYEGYELSSEPNFQIGETLFTDNFANYTLYNVTEGYHKDLKAGSYYQFTVSLADGNTFVGKSMCMFTNSMELNVTNASTGESFELEYRYDDDDSEAFFTLYAKHIVSTDFRAAVDITEVSNVVYPIDPKYLPKAEVVADAAGDTPTAAEFNALLASLRAAGYLSE